MEKASSLIEAEETLDTEAGKEGGIRSEGSSDVTSRSETPSFERTQGRYDGQQEGVETPVNRGSSVGAHERTFKPIESGVFSGLARRDSARSVHSSHTPASSHALMSDLPTNHASSSQIAVSLQNALSSASRGEAELGALHRSIRDASRALTASRQAHETLTEELRMMHRSLSEVLSEKAAVERYAALLTQERDAALDAAEEARREAKRDREFLLHEQDRFIQLLLEEHEAELQQLRHALRGTVQSGPAHAGRVPAPSGIQVAADADSSERGATTMPGIAPATIAASRVQIDDPEGERPTSPAPDATGSASTGAVARLQLASTSLERHRAIPLPDPAERGAFDKTSFDAQGSEAALGRQEEDRHSTYPPPPAVLDLDSLAHEIDGNSERPPPIRRMGLNEPKLHLRPARVPTQLLDTLVSKTGDDPSRKG